MVDSLIDLLRETGFQSNYGILVILILRPLGLCYGFIAFTWALRYALVLRISIAIALALPVAVVSVSEIETLVTEPDIARLFPLALKEFGLGFGIGFLASLPFYALQYAGAITDAFRGESDSGTMDPQGGTIHTFSLLYLAIGFFAFFSAGGLPRLVQGLYESYGVWPIDTLVPSIDLTVAMRLGDVLMQTLRQSLGVALPLLALLVAIEFTVSIAARLARRFNLYELAFPLRNVAAVLTLPLVAWLVWTWTADIVERAAEGPAIQRLLLP